MTDAVVREPVASLDNDSYFAPDIAAAAALIASSDVVRAVGLPFPALCT